MTTTCPESRPYRLLETHGSNYYGQCTRKHRTPVFSSDLDRGNVLRAGSVATVIHGIGTTRAFVVVGRRFQALFPVGVDVGIIVIVQRVLATVQGLWRPGQCSLVAAFNAQPGAVDGAAVCINQCVALPTVS